MWLDRILDRQATRTPDAVALRDVRRELSWQGLRREVYNLARQLADRFPAGERVLVVSDNRVEVIETYLACGVAGLVAVPVNANLADAEIEYIIGYTGPSLAVAQESSRKRLHALSPDLPSMAIEDLAALPGDGTPVADRQPTLDDPFAILHTSATTGHPKGAVIDHRYLQTNVLSWLGDVRPAPGGSYLNASPLFHGSMVIALNNLAAGVTVGVLDRFTPQGCLTALAQWRVQVVLLVPSMIRLLLQSRALESADLSCVELILHTAEPMPATLTDEAARAFRVPLLNVYGITEGGGPVATCRSDEAPRDARFPGATCAGVPMLGVDLRVLREDGELAAGGEIGEVCLHGDGIMREYWRRPEATAQAIRGGWLHTGDLGYLDDDGRLWLVDRRTDLILRGGQNVYPAEIERVLRASPQVADVAVVAAPSPTWGHTPWAFVQPRDPDAFDERELLDRAVGELASYKRPSRFVPVETIPRNPSGKLLRRLLREEAVRIMDEERR
jgi:acyl-CoA synthetase (AMP-forming)/AMP-acid ligase II